MNMKLTELNSLSPKTETQTPMLIANKVDKFYDNGTHALDNLNLKIYKGEIVALLGPSGCGKSTLLRMFADLEQPTAGQILWNSKKILHEQCRMSMVFQEATLMPWANILDNVSLPLSLKKENKQKIKEKAEKVLSDVGLAKFASSLPKELSGGMQMRASLARALISEPNLLLMDEPFGALDEFTRHKLDLDIRTLWEKRDLTIVFVTHSIFEALFLSSRIIVMGARPSRVIADIKLPDVQRNDEYKTSEEFIKNCAHISKLLEDAHDEI